MCHLEFCSETESVGDTYVCMCIYKDRNYKELTHMVMEAKFQDLQSGRRDPGELMV